MGKKRPRKPNGPPKPPAKRPTSAVAFRQLPDGTWGLTHPRCARERGEDLEEVRMMIEGEEFDIATDELRWLLSGCSEFVEAHLLSGQVAIAGFNDLPLARGHLGYAWQLGLKAWCRAKSPAKVSATHPANVPWLESGSALAWCLEKLGKSRLADEIINTLRRLDPADPLQAAAMLDDLRNDGLELFELK